jgi:hypothetical protein
MGLREVRWDRSGTEPAGEYTFSYGKGNENHELGIGFLYITSRNVMGSILDEVIGFFN